MRFGLSGVRGGLEAHGTTLETPLDTMIDYWEGVPITVTGIDHTVAPAPVQCPHPPVFVGGYRAATLAWAAQRGFATIQHGIQYPASLRRSLHLFASEVMPRSASTDETASPAHEPRPHRPAHSIGTRQRAANRTNSASAGRDTVQ